MPRLSCGLVWLRRDLRLEDHAALSTALAQCAKVWCVFVFDRDILDPLLARSLRRDRRVEFILESLIPIDNALRKIGSGLIVRHDFSADAIVQLAAQVNAQAVYANHDYEPAAVARDMRVAQRLADAGRRLETFKDQVIFERDEIMTRAGEFYSVFTPYKKSWLTAVDKSSFTAHRVDLQPGGPMAPVPAGLDLAMPSLQSMGFEPSNLAALPIVPGMHGAQALLTEFLGRIDRYDVARDFPSVKGPSYLSVHLRFGTISIRQAAKSAYERALLAAGGGAQTWLSELIWREFYFQILFHRPRVVDHAFRPEYDAIQWESGEQADKHFQAWCKGCTGYPLVDAAMAQINSTGYMHNRLRMLVASFLTKDLGIDWRRGAGFFEDQLIDFDLAANNGGWQWAASTGCDAQPYFRIFNPVTQSKRFDAQGAFIRRYLPQLAQLSERDIHAPWLTSSDLLATSSFVLGRDYPRPIVDHDVARQKTLQRYKAARSIPESM